MADTTENTGPEIAAGRERAPGSTPTPADGDLATRQAEHKMDMERRAADRADKELDLARKARGGVFGTALKGLAGTLGVVGGVVAADKFQAYLSGGDMVSKNLRDMLDASTGKQAETATAGERRAQALEQGIQMDPAPVAPSGFDANAELRSSFAVAVTKDATDLVDGLNQQAGSLGIAPFDATQARAVADVFERAILNAGDPLDNPDGYWRAFVEDAENGLQGISGLSQKHFQLLDRYILDGSEASPQADNNFLKRATTELDTVMSRLGR